MSKSKQQKLPISRDLLIRKVPRETVELLDEAAKIDRCAREEKVRRILEEWVEANTEPA